MTLSDKAKRFIKLYCEDVIQNPDVYKLSVSNNPRAAALNLIEGLDDSEVEQLTKDFLEELSNV